MASAGPQGYLFAGQSEADLLDEITWDRRFFGATNLNLEQLDASGAPRETQWLQSPLRDGASWPYFDFNLTATAAEVPTPTGPAPGFRITGGTDDYRMELDYAPTVGAVTHYTAWDDNLDLAAETLDMTATGISDSWMWFTRDTEVYAGAGVRNPASFDPANPQGTSPVVAPAQFTVPESSEVVILWALTSPGSKAIVTRPPPEQPWTYDGAGVPAFKIEQLPATTGEWFVTGMPSEQTGWVYVQAHAVDWMPGP